MTTRDHAAALALLDKITPGPWAVDGHDGCIVTQSGKGEWDIADVYGHNVNNIRAIAALPELAEAWRKGLAYREAEHDYVAAAEAEDADYDPLKVGDMRARLHAAAAAFDAALAAVADKLNGEGK